MGALPPRAGRAAACGRPCRRRTGAAGRSGKARSMSLGSITQSAPHVAPSSSTRWIAATVASVAVWFAVYWYLQAFADWTVSRLPLDPASHLHDALAFFIYDTPKVLMLLTLIVFAMGVVRSFF